MEAFYHRNSSQNMMQRPAFLQHITCSSKLLFDQFKLRHLVHCPCSITQIERLFDADEFPNELAMIFLHEDTTQPHTHHFLVPSERCTKIPQETLKEATCRLGVLRVVAWNNFHSWIFLVQHFTAWFEAAGVQFLQRLHHRWETTVLKEVHTHQNERVA